MVLRPGQYFVRVPLGDITVVPASEQDGAYSPNTVVTLTAKPKESGDGLFINNPQGLDLGKVGLVWVGVDVDQGGTGIIQMLEDRSVEIQPRTANANPFIPCG